MTPGSPRIVGRYLLCEPIAHGGMATVHLGRLIGPEGFSRTVAIKQLHQQLFQNPEFVSMFLDEARLASRVCHPHVVSPLDVISAEGELFIVMDYVHGVPLSRLLCPPAGAVPARVAVAIIGQVLLGLQAAHEASGENGEPLELVHRDVTPQNILVAQDGMARVVDFGIAKGRTRTCHTERGKLKGKLGYMAPEQLSLETVDQRADLFAVGVVLWELLSGRRLFCADNPAATLHQLLSASIERPSAIRPGLPTALDDVVLRALARSADERFPSARAMNQALEAALGPASVLEVAAWVDEVCGPELAARAERVIEVEGISFEELTQTLRHPLLTRSRATPVAIDESRRDSVSPAELGQAPLVPRRPHALRSWPSLGVCAVVLAALLAWTRGQQTALVALERVPREMRVAEQPLQLRAARNTAFAAAAPAAVEAVHLHEPASDGVPRRAAQVKRVKGVAGRGRPTVASSCDVPFWFDGRGIKHFKEQCI